MGNPNPGSREVFDAFHTKAEPAKTFTSRSEAPLFVPPPAIYPNEFRTFDGKQNNISDLGAAGKPDLRTTTIGYGDGVGSPRERIGSARARLVMTWMRRACFP